MFDFLRQYQLNIMLILSGICGILPVFVLCTNAISKKRKFILVLMELCASLLLIFDRFAYIFRGNVSNLGWWMVRISNFSVYFLSLFILYTFNLYLQDLFTHEGGLKAPPKRLQIVEAFVLVGEFLIVLSSFTGLYYTFDSTNHYQRAPLFMICYFFPLSIAILQFAVIAKNYKRLNKGLRVSLVLFTLIPIVATLIQVFTYGLSLTNISLVGDVVLLYIFALKDLSDSAERANQLKIDVLTKEQKNMLLLFEQTAEALANAIDAKDKYTHGHSTRVAEYSKKIAILAGYDEKFCEEIYFAALLHDVGKIGIPDKIINKEGKLTEEEFAQIKQHPVIGQQILSSINQSPYLSIGALWHHERYDGKGYPYALKGDDIPVIARIIAVADAYDAMTSKRSYRDPIPQEKVREEIVKGFDAQFDPKFAKIMLHLIDLDEEYQLQEHNEVRELAGKHELVCEEYLSAFSEGIIVTRNITRMHLHCSQNATKPAKDDIPSFVVFDSLDAHLHTDEEKQKVMNFCEYADIRFDGNVKNTGSRKVETQITDNPAAAGLDYDIEAVKYDDHVLIIINGGGKTIRIILALPDCIRYAYLGLTGKHCTISNVEINKDEDAVEESYIPRIAEKIDYLKGEPEGDIPNVLVNGWRSNYSLGTEIKDSLEISFRAKSLPTARLIWHCPFVSILSSDDGQINGPGFREYALLRLDGENWEPDAFSENTIQVIKTDDFAGWEAWKENLKKGIDCKLILKRIGNQVSMKTENSGLIIKSVTTIKNIESDRIFIALTGDQCTLSRISIK